MPESNDSWKGDVVRLFDDIAGPPLRQISELFATELQYWRAKQLIRVGQKAKKLIDENDLSAGSYSIKILVPLLEAASLEEEELLQDKWAAMLANALTGGASHPRYSLLLANMAEADVLVLDALADAHETEWQASLFGRSPLDAYDAPIVNPYLIWDEVLHNNDVLANKIDAHTRHKSLEEILDNLFGLGLINFLNSFVPADLDQVEQYTRNLGKSVPTRSYKNCVFTQLGLSFVAACRIPTEEDL